MASAVETLEAAAQTVTAGWPRVTQILKDAGLIDVSWFEPRHSRRGRLVDAACNILGKGCVIDPAWWHGASGEPGRDDDYTRHEVCRPFIDAYLSFLRETGFTMTHCAVEVRNTVVRVIGHIDQIGTLDTGLQALVDIKTGGESKWHPLQLGGYHPAVIETLKIVPVRYNLYLTDDGKYRLVRRHDARDINEFLCLARAWWVCRKYKGAA